MINILTYGTFDLFHIGHLRLLERARSLGDRLIVGVSTDDFNAEKGKKTAIPFEERCNIVASLRCVDAVIPEQCWAQKHLDIQKHDISIFVMGNDWEGKFDHLNDICNVVYLSRTDGISTTYLKQHIAASNSHFANEQAT